jgi:hypothetical protein
MSLSGMVLILVPTTMRIEFHSGVMYKYNVIYNYYLIY